MEWAILGLKSGKSPGYDNVPAELIKESGNSGVLIYHLLVKKIWNTEAYGLSIGKDQYI